VENIVVDVMIQKKARFLLCTTQDSLKIASPAAIIHCARKALPVDIGGVGFRKAKGCGKVRSLLGKTRNPEFFWEFIGRFQGAFQQSDHEFTLRGF